MKKDEKRLIHKALDGEANKTETRRLVRKIESDGKVRSEFEGLKKVVHDTEKLRKVDVPADFVHKVMKGLQGQSPPSPKV